MAWSRPRAATSPDVSVMPGILAQSYAIFHNEPPVVAMPRLDQHQPGPWVKGDLRGVGRYPTSAQLGMRQLLAALGPYSFPNHMTSAVIWSWVVALAIVVWVWATTSGKPDYRTDWEGKRLTDEADDRSRTKLEALGRLHTLNVERFYERRRVEWRLTFTLWAALGLATNAISRLPALERQHVWYIAAGVFVLVALHAAWEKVYMVRAAKKNRFEGYRITNTILKSIGMDDDIDKPGEYKAFWSHYWQAAVTFGLGAGMVFVAYLNTI